MKKILYVIVAMVMLLGCDSFLEDKPLTIKTSSNFPRTEEDAKQMMAGIYTTMNNAQRNADVSYLFVCEVASDDKLGGGGLNDVKAQAYENFMYSDPEMLRHAWQTTYTGIYRANFAIENVDNLSEVLSENLINQYKGEALFLRAWFYYQLTSLFGEVPLTISTEPENLPAASIEELYGQMASDLKTAIEIMPKVKYDQTEEGRVTRWAAEALMARIYLFYTGFYQKDALPLADGGSVTKQNVIDWLDDCIENSGHYLVDDFHELWPYTNSNSIKDYPYIQDYMTETGKNLIHASNKGARNPEAMFVLQFNNFHNWDVGRGMGNMYQLFFALRGLQPVSNTYPFAGGWGQGNSVPKSLVDQWLADEPNDIRLWASVIDIEKEIIPSGYKRGEWDFVMESNYWGKKMNGIAGKTDEGGYVNDYNVVESGTEDNNQLSHKDDLMYIRFADVLLMMSELTENAAYMNEVRERAGLPEVPYSLEALQKERRYELAFEGLRWNDMRRWGANYAKSGLESQVGVPIYNFGALTTHQPLHSEGYSSRYDDTKGFFPIPQSQVDISDGQLEQVEGYRDGNGLYTGWPF